MAGPGSSDAPFRSIFRTVVEQSAAVYGPAWPGCSLAVSRVDAHPRTDDPTSDEWSYAVAATTHHGAGPAVVELSIFPDAFGPVAFAAVPALLARECVDHVPAGPRDSALDGVAAGEPDGDVDRGLFQEGFLDWAAEFLHDRWTGLLDPDLSGPARRHGMVVLLMDRMGPTARCHSRRVGRRAAEEVAGWFRSVARLSVEEAAASVVRLAVELNINESPPECKDLAVSRLRFTPYPAELGAELADWAEHRCGVAAILRASGSDEISGAVERREQAAR